MSDDLKDVQCDVCGCYCFGSEPHPWKMRQTQKGEIKMCTSCARKYEGDEVDDPARDYRVRALSAELAEVEERATELEAALDEL